MTVARATHSMIRVLDEGRSVAFYENAFSGFALVYLRNEASPFELELTVNFDRKEPYELGDGSGHLAVTVDAVDEDHARLTDAGLEPGPLRDFKHDGRTLARFFFITDPDGYKIEVIQRGGRFQ